MSPKRILLLSLLPAWLLARSTTAQDAPAQAAPLLLDGVAAEVGETRITVAEVMLAARERAAALQIPPSEQAAQLRELYAQARDELIARTLVLKAYEQSPNKLQPWVVDQRIETMIEERFGGDRSKLVSLLAREHLTYDTWRRRIEEEIIVGSMRHAEVDQKVVVAPADVRAYYATNSAAFSLRGPVRVGLIQLRAGEGETAEALAARGRDLVARLTAGQDFAVLARQHSCEAHAAEGGDWGYVTPAEEFRPEIVAALSELQPGACSGVIETDAGLYIVRKTAEQRDLRLPLAEAWPEIEGKLRRLAAERRFRGWIERLEQDTFVRRYPLP